MRSTSLATASARTGGVLRCGGNAWGMPRRSSWCPVLLEVNSSQQPMTSPVVVGLRRGGWYLCCRRGLTRKARVRDMPRRLLVASKRQQGVKWLPSPIKVSRHCRLQRVDVLSVPASSHHTIQPTTGSVRVVMDGARIRGSALRLMMSWRRESKLSEVIRAGLAHQCCQEVEVEAESLAASGPSVRQCAVAGCLKMRMHVAVKSKGPKIAADGRDAWESLPSTQMVPSRMALSV